jgi:5-methylcytosine-specific restriction enzyme subunit McrC
MDQIDPQLRKTAGRLALRLSEVGRGTFTKADFAIRIDRNLKRYALAIGVCKFLHESTLIDDEGQSRFVDFSRDEVAMRDIFERFVRNLLRHKLGPPYIVSRRKFPFAKLHGSPHDITYVPTMLTDVVVECSSSALVIEVKYVPGATQVYRGVERFRSTHLYQLLSYLGNYPDDKKALSGLLLYPATTRSLSASVVMRDLPVDIAEIDLSLDWFEIEARLLGLVRSIFDRVAVGSLQVAA